MKRLIIISVLFTTIFSGCKSDFLDQEPPLYVTETDVFTSAARIESTLLGIYGQFKNVASYSFMGGKTYVVFDNRGDDFINISSNLVVLFDTYNMKVGATYAENETTWTQAYTTVNKCNGFLEALEKSKDVAGANFDRYKAEALFVRALTYYYLNSLYGMPYKINQNAKSVPLRMKYEGDGTNNGLPRSTVKQVYDQILADLAPMSALPTANKTYAGVTRATQAAANMLKMRVYMAMENWDQAIAAGTAISGYALEASASAPFGASKLTGENIFSLPMETTNRPNTQQAVAEYYFNGTIMLIDTISGIMAKPNYHLAADQRIVAFKGANRIYKKFVDNSAKLEWVPIFRYAETLLNLSECYVNKGNSASAKSALKQVRNRSITVVSDPLDIDALNDADLRTAIYNERRLELMGEAIRGIDIHRRGENYIKASTNINVAPSTGTDSYIWPMPQSEINLNPDLEK